MDGLSTGAQMARRIETPTHRVLSIALDERGAKRGDAMLHVPGDNPNPWLDSDPAS